MASAASSASRASSSIDLGGYAIPVGRLLTLDPALRKANAEATGAGMWMSALSAEQFQGVQIARERLDNVEHAVVHGVARADGARLERHRSRSRKPQESSVVDLKTVREEVARLFRDWASRGRVPESEQLAPARRHPLLRGLPRRDRHAFARLADDDGGPRRGQRFEPALNPEAAQSPWEHLCILEEPERERYLATDVALRRTRWSCRTTSARRSRSFRTVSRSRSSPWQRRSRGTWSTRIARLNNRHPGLDARVLRDPDPDYLFYDLDVAPPTVLHYVGLGQFNQGRDEISIGGQFGSVEMLIDALPASGARGW